MVPVLRRRTALHPLAAAAERGHLAAVGRLLELGAPPNHDASVAAGVLQTTPLMLAAGNGHLAVAERLLEGGASPFKANSREETAAALALRGGHLAVVRRLLQHGGELVAAGEAEPGVAARPQLANASRAWQMGFQSGQLGLRGCTSLAALEQERQRYQLLLLALLQAAGGSAHAAAEVRQLAPPSAVARAAAGSDALLAALLACGVGLDAVDAAGGPTALDEAAQLGWPTLQRLLRRGANPNQADSRGSTVLSLLAARPGLADTAQQLLAWAEEQEVAAAAAGDGGQAQAQRLDALRVDAEGRDALGVALAAKNRRFADLLVEHLARQQQRSVAAALGGSPGAAAAWPPAPPATPPAAAAGGGGGEAVPGVAARAYELLTAAGARRLSDINKPGPDGKHPLLAQVGSGGGGVACEGGSALGSCWGMRLLSRPPL